LGGLEIWKLKKSTVVAMGHYSGGEWVCMEISNNPWILKHESLEYLEEMLEEKGIEYIGYSRVK
jgi:hypothetical protein